MKSKWNFKKFLKKTRRSQMTAIGELTDTTRESKSTALVLKICKANSDWEWKMIILSKKKQKKSIAKKTSNRSKVKNNPRRKSFLVQLKIWKDSSILPLKILCLSQNSYNKSRKTTSSGNSTQRCWNKRRNWKNRNHLRVTKKAISRSVRTKCNTILNS